MAENNNKNGDNKNSFRDMMLIIFVVLICFGITIYGIAYLTSKVFSGSSEEVIPVAEVMPEEVTTNPAEGDTIELGVVEDEADSNISSKIETKVTKAKELDVPEIENRIVEEKKEVPAADTKKQEVAKPVKTEPKKEVKKEKAAAEKPKVKETAKEKPAEKSKEVKRAVEKRKTYVVQIIAVQNKNTANKEAEKYRKRYPDVYVAPVYINGKTLYRVRLGVNEDRSVVQKTADEIKRIYKIQPLVVQNN